MKNSERAIVNDNSYGPIFGHGNAYEICLFYPFLSNSIQIQDGGDYGDKNYILTGKNSDKPEEIELYKVFFKNIYNICLKLSFYNIMNQIIIFMFFELKIDIILFFQFFKVLGN